MTNAKRQKHLVNEYKGYTVPNNHTDIDVIEKFPENHDEWFFNNFIKLRKPAKIKSQCPINIDEFKFDKLKEKLQYQDKLQIEKKFNNGFGSGLQRELKTFDEILSIFENGDDSYYLTTQYNQEEPEEEEDQEGEEEDEEGEEEDDEEEEEEEDDEDDEDEDEEEEEEEGTAFSDTSSIGSIDMNNLRDDFDDCDDSLIDEKHQLSYADIQSRVKELLQPPLTNLYKDENFPLVPQFLSSLIPQQINLWMGNGKNTGGSIEDMDFDNLSLDEIGKRIPGNGTSSGLHHDHADNLYILIQGTKRFTLYSPNDTLKLFTVGEIYKIFQNGLIDYEISEFSKNWKHIRDDGAMLINIAEWKIANSDFSTWTEDQILEIIEKDKAQCLSKPTKGDPPSFSKIPPLLLHLDELKDSSHIEKLTNFANEYFPGFLDLNKLQVWLKPGEQLYLPTGWFHEVSSFAQDELNPTHIAINYWFIPPTEFFFHTPYKDTYWQEDFDANKASIEHLKKGIVQL
ncbi:Clavaminate synthase-like protein [Hyphopichia burtonii NRRL Y-1933]|uniref:Clavaminate synthase-like protein n=1 Tax=Hyphopichia burtonii NRRL Y-1933 TaxID=984485 RepID=A0A1E4RCD9_9ASCO|nr:Clavaminate synthase-like protein [Hyphopichia burtonii NRRL Y-1933]ODV64795.1 Clavaminate synthase-like protein [Hyphopichia burtonii NRRL Y-1933]